VTTDPGQLFDPDHPEELLEGDRDGHTYDHEKDYARLNAQHRRVYRVMSSGAWYTLAEISDQTGDPEASISARIRDFRKARFGGHTVERRRHEDTGLWLYRLIWNPDVPQPLTPAPAPILEEAHR
jgi:hypothetical protein